MVQEPGGMNEIVCFRMETLCIAEVFQFARVFSIEKPYTKFFRHPM